MKLPGLAALILTLMSLTLGGCAANPPGQKSAEPGWYSAWAMSHNARVAANMSGRTVRQILTPSIAGESVRVKIENTMGQTPVTFSGASIGLTAQGAAIREGTLKRLTFGGQPGITLAPGAGAYSDPVSLKFAALQQLTLNLEVQSAADVSTHHVGLRINWSSPGARAFDISPVGFDPLPEVPPLNSGQWPFYWVAALDVKSETAAGGIVLFGDSITDGRCSTRDEKGIVRPNLDQRWGDAVISRLAERAKKDRVFHMSVTIASIVGNRVLGRGNGPSAFERLERDVLDRSGATHLVFFMGTNDIAGGFSAEQVRAGIQQIIALVRSRGLKIIGVTAVPRGRPAPAAGWSGAMEKQRLALNAWIRTQAGFDGVVDFDALMKRGPLVKLNDGNYAPAMPDEWNCDNTHPNAAGYRAMGEFIDLNLFR